MDPELLRRYLRLGLAFDRVEEGFVDAYFGPPQLRAEIENAPAPDPRALAAEARGLLADLEAESAAPSDPAVDPVRGEFVRSHVAALECSARKFAGEEIAFVDEVRAYFDVDIAATPEEEFAAAHRELDALLEGGGTVAERYQAYRERHLVPPQRLAEVVGALAGALRDRVREAFPLNDAEVVNFEVVSDKPWSGFNYYHGGYRSTVAINGDIGQYLTGLPHLVAHEAYPGHHTEHSRKEAGLVEADGQLEQTLFLVNTPQCLMAEGLADHALRAAVPDWGPWAAEIYADLGFGFDGEFAMRVAAAAAPLGRVRQDAALRLHSERADADAVVEFLSRWNLGSEAQAKQSLRFLASPLWRAYVSTYVEGYALLGTWLDRAETPAQRLAQFGRLLDEPLTPAALRNELAGVTRSGL